MMVREVKYVSGAVSVDKCPPQNFPEYAFCGRSNVGKSSMINMLTGTKALARTSSTPGKTRIINHFLVNNQWYLVDLPGYGFARSSKTNREAWRRMINDYLENRKNLVSVFLLVDSRLAPQALDIQFMELLASLHKAFAVLFTKTDKLSKNQLRTNVSSYLKYLEQAWETPPPIILTSAITRLGRDNVLNYIETGNAMYSASS